MSKITSKTRLQGITPEDSLSPALETGNLAILAGTVSGGHLQVDVLSGGGAGEQYADNAVVNVAYKGNLILGTDGSNYQVISVDASGNVQVDIVSSASIAVTNAGITSIDGKITACNTGAVVVASGVITSITNAVAVTGTFYQATQPVSIASAQVASGAYASGSISDGADVTQGAKADARNAATDATAITIMQVLKEISYMEQNPASRAVTNAGTFVVQATLATETTKVIGTINVAASQTIAVTNAGTFAVQAVLGAGTAEIGKLAAGTAEIGNVKNSGTFAVQAACVLGAETTKVIGTVNISASQTVGLVAGTAAIGKLAANSGVDIGDVDVISIIPGVGATNLGKAIDTALGATDTGVLALAVRDDTLNIRSGTENDVEPLHTDVVGALWTRDTSQLVDDAAFGIATGRVTPIGLLADETSTDSVDEGDIGAPRMTLDRKQIVVLSPHATGESLDIFFSIDLDESEEDIKATAGKIYGYYIYNNAAATQYVRFYNATAANTTVGTTAAILVIPVPAGSAANCAFPQGIGFSTALCAAATTGVAADDTGAPSANTIIIDVFYK